MNLDTFNLNRFILAQNRVYDNVLAELQDGNKRTHWMWYIFPQLKSLGYRYKARFYGISGIEEAQAYIANSTLETRLKKVCEIILQLPVNDAVEIFGRVDAMKLRSSMTLFDLISPNDVYARVLEKYYQGQRDERTISIIDND